MKALVREKTSLRKIFKNCKREHVDLLESMLSFDPAKRVSAKSLLENPVFDMIRNKEMEKGCPRNIKVPIDSMDVSEKTDIR